MTDYDVISLDSNFILHAVGYNKKPKMAWLYPWIIKKSSKIILFPGAKREIKMSMKYNRDENINKKMKKIYENIRFEEIQCITEKQHLNKIFETAKDKAGDKGRRWMLKKYQFLSNKRIINYTREELEYKLYANPISESTQEDIKKSLKALCKKILEKDKILIASALALARQKTTAFVTLDSEIILFKDEIEKLEDKGKLGIISGYNQKELPN